MCLRYVFLPLVVFLLASYSFSQDTIRKHYEAAEAHRRAGNLTGAETEFVAILAEGYDRLGKIYLAQKVYEKAVTSFEAVTMARPKEPVAQIDLAVAYFELARYEKAFESLQRALAIDSRNAGARHMLGKVLFMKGDFTGAATELETAVKLAPKDYDASYTLGLAYLKQNQLATAKQIYSRMLRQLGARAQLHIIFGRAYRETGFFEDAIAEFKKAVALDPKSSRAHYYLGLTYLLKDGSSRLDDAAKEFSIALASNPNDYFANYYLGIIHLKERRLEQAISLLEEASRIQPDNPDPYYHLGQAYQAAEKRDRVIEVLKKSIALTPSASHNDYQVARAHYQLGQSLLKAGRIEEGEKELKLAAELKAESLKNEEIKTANYLNSTGIFEQSAKLTEMVSAASGVASPGDSNNKETAELKSGEDYYTKIVASSHNNIGMLRAGRQDFREAAEQFAKAAKWNPGLEQIHYNCGLAFFKAELYQQAIQPLESELKLNPTNVQVKQLLGTSYFMTDGYPKASELLTDAIAARTNDTGLFYMLAISLIKQKKQEAANQVIQRMIAQTGDTPQLHILLGQAHYDRGETDKALEELNAALALDSKTRLAHFYAGLIYLNLGKHDEALREFQSEMAINPNDFQAKYHFGFVLLADQKTERGIKIMREIIQLRPEYAEAHYELGKALLLQGNIKEALERLETAVKLKPDEAFVHYQLGRAYLASGRKAEGENHIEISNRIKAKERGQANP